MSFNRELLNKCFNELAKLYKKAKRHNPNTKFEIIVVGGGAIVEKYNFRFMTNDVDADGDIFNQCVKEVAKKLNINEEWLNNDFKRTSSYSPKLIQYSEFHRKFLDILDVRLVSREYLIATKLKSFRGYKNDLSDIVGILIEESKQKPISLNEIKIAVKNLYGSYDKSLKNEAKQFIEEIIVKSSCELNKIYQKVRKQENNRHDKLLQIEKYDKGILTKKNVDEIVKKIDQQKSATEILKELSKRKEQEKPKSKKIM